MLSDVNRIKLVSEISTIFPFFNRKAKIIKFDLAIKKVKVTPGSSFAQTIMGRSPDATYQVLWKLTCRFR